MKYSKTGFDAPFENPVCFTPNLVHSFCVLFQRQVAGEVQTQPQGSSLNQIAMMLAIMGLSLSYYSAKQMTVKVQREPVP